MKEIVLYHGSDISVQHPQILKEKSRHDFGTAFYLTTNYDQANKWAKHKFKRNGYVGKPRVSVFSFNLQALSQIKVKKFDSSTTFWLEYVMKNRLGFNDENFSDYDLVIGPLIDGYLSWRTLKMYSRHQITYEEAITRLHPENLDNQWAFKSKKSLNYLKYKGTL